ncbi:PD40 domain-containing protein [Chryseobacterium defluvii]|uniref:WD40 repeat protein n=1 Tax=Chryseobacterium defluvii TaxID=160396 RepID=A0A495SAV1_9FLAO|nr:PD40 domain-containing protein [Chryseobacterium defluvii]RKS97382.1 WD40 repeat protein [Chryseobacterium defluvii]
MKTLLPIIFLLVTNIIAAQTQNAITLFNKKLNQFLNVRDFSISEDGNEAFFTIQSPNQEVSQIAYIKKEKNTWSEPQLLSFNNTYSYLEPFLTNSGNRLYFISDQPLDTNKTEKKDFDIWYVERKNKNSEWSKPVNIGKPVNSEMNEFYPTIADNGNLYFTMESPKGLGKDDIYFCTWENHTYSEPQLLDENINSSGYEFNAFISKKENFILFTKYNEKGGQGSGDLYIARKNPDGKWQKAENLGIPINTKYMEYCPFYDESNQILYFTSRRNNLAPKRFKNISEFQEYVNDGENGLSKIYQVPFKIK